MSHCAVFKKSNNDEGFISVICHRERYLEELKADGWSETPEEAMSETPKKSDTLTLKKTESKK